MSIMGLDLSLTGTGCIVLINDTIECQQLIKSSPTGKDPVSELERLINIKNKIYKLIEEKKPSIVLIEGLAFMARNTTALVQLAALNYMVREMLYNYNIKFIIVAPTTLKKFATGKGNAKKDLMLLEAYKRYNIEFNDDNLCDAFMLAKLGESLVSNEEKYLSYQKEVIKLIKEQYERE